MKNKISRIVRGLLGWIVFFGGCINAKMLSNSEHYQAYLYAHDLGLTSLKTIYTQPFDQPITRTEAAYILVTYATKVLFMQGKNYEYCAFRDIQHLSISGQNTIVEACALGIMGKGQEYFFPDRIITRAEFATALSRLLRGDKFENTGIFYKDHLYALLYAGILKSLEHPWAKELRGYAWLMLMRTQNPAYEAYLGCETPEEIFFCDLGRSMGVELCQPECLMKSTMNVGVLGISTIFIPSYHSKDVQGLYQGTLVRETQDIPIRLTSVKLTLTGENITKPLLRRENTEGRITRKLRPSISGEVVREINTIIKPKTKERWHLMSTISLEHIQISKEEDVVSSALFTLGTFPVVIKD